jgi:hypothetical protein
MQMNNQKKTTMKTITMKMLMALTFVAALCLNSCKKESPVTAGQGFKTTTDMDENVSSLINFGLDNALTSTGKGATNWNTEAKSTMCGTVTLDTSSKPWVETIDFTNGCFGNDGKFYQGKITLTFDEAWTIANSTFTLNYINCTVDSTTIFNGGYTMHDNGPVGPNGDTTLTMTVNMQLTKGTVTTNVNGNYLYDWSSGQHNPNYNDQWTITGSETAIQTNGDSALTQITKPLIKNWNHGRCNDYEGGIVKITSNFSPTKAIGYGIGPCSYMESVTVNGVTTTKHQ